MKKINKRARSESKKKIKEAKKSNLKQKILFKV